MKIKNIVFISITVIVTLGLSVGIYHNIKNKDNDLKDDSKDNNVNIVDNKIEHNNQKEDEENIKNPQNDNTQKKDKDDEIISNDNTEKSIFQNEKNDNINNNQEQIYNQYENSIDNNQNTNSNNNQPIQDSNNSVDNYPDNSSNNSNNQTIEIPIDLNDEVIDTNPNDDIYTEDECSKVGIEIWMNNKDDIINFYCNTYSENGKFLGYKLDINCKSGDCSKYEAEYRKK